ncbi:ATP-binding protein [Limosilactobacillus reuteri]
MTNERRLLRNIEIPSIEDNDDGLLKIVQLHRRIRNITSSIKPKTEGIRFVFDNCTDFSPSGIAYLGAISTRLKSKKIRVYYNFRSMPQNILNLFKETGFLQKNFHKHFAKDKIPSTSINFENFVGNIQTDAQVSSKIVNYIQSKWLSDNNISIMPLLKEALSSKMFELFANALEHSKSPLGCFCCGKNFNEKGKQRLTLTIIDLGIGIVNSVKKYFSDNEQKISSEAAVKWAFTYGKTTRSDQSGGLGLALVEDFLNVSNGEMKILCNDTQLDIKGNNKKYSFMPVAFSGTIIEINMRPSEHGLYGFKNEFEGVYSS